MSYHATVRKQHAQERKLAKWKERMNQTRNSQEISFLQRKISILKMENRATAKWVNHMTEFRNS